MHNWKDNLARVEDEPALVKDLFTGAVIDRDTSAYVKYLAAKNARQQQRDQIDSLESRINNVEHGITDIKSLLTRLLENQNGHNN